MTSDLLAEHFQQRERILRRGAFGIVVEVNVHIAVFMEQAFGAFCPFFESGLAIARRVFPGVPVQTDVNEIRCHPIPHRPVRRVGDTDRGGVFRQAFGYFVVEPRFVAKFDGMPRGFPVPQRLQEFFKALDILFKKRGKLPHNSGQSFAEW